MTRQLDQVGLGAREPRQADDRYLRGDNVTAIAAHMQQQPVGSRNEPAFGNLVGDTGDGGASAARVNALDLAAVKRALGTAAPVHSLLDFNRDGRINALDLATVRQNLGRSLPLWSLPAAVPTSMPAPLQVRSLWRDDAPAVLD